MAVAGEASARPMEELPEVCASEEESGCRGTRSNRVMVQRDGPWGRQDLTVSTGMRPTRGSRESFPAWASSRKGKKEGKSLKCFPHPIFWKIHHEWCLRNQGSGWEGQVKLGIQATQPAPILAHQDIALSGLTGLCLQAILSPVKSSIQLCLAQQPR